MRRLLAPALLTALLGAGDVQAACPCYTASSASNTYNCAIEAVPGTNPTVAEWQSIFDLVAAGPSAWGTDGPAVANIGQGCGKPEPTTQVPAKFPCELLRAMAMQESGWRQFCVPTSPSDQVGKSSRTIIAFDCGYGVGQVTSGMHVGESPSFNRTRVAAEPTYNMATGAAIFAGKWRATNCVGDNQPKVVEHWYTAVWAYNGLTYSNNPNNPNYSSTRGVWNPSVGGAVPYQERVFGWLEHPPSTSHWPVLRPAYPALADIGSGSSPPALPEPSCASPTSCTNKRSTHVSRCFQQQGTDGGTDAGTVTPDAGTKDAGVLPVTDAGAPVDAGGQTPDAGGEEPDAGLPAFPKFVDAVSRDGAVAELPAETGCGCASAGLAPVPLLLLLLRRRRSAAKA